MRQRTVGTHLYTRSYVRLPSDEWKRPATNAHLMGTDAAGRVSRCSPYACQGDAGPLSLFLQTKLESEHLRHSGGHVQSCAAVTQKHRPAALEKAGIKL